MRRAGGYAVMHGPDGTKECDTFQCAHCGGHTHVPPRASPTDLGGYCGRCAAPVCPACHRRGTCTPFQKALERMEARGRLRRSLDAAM